jgi:hypothetical protein
LEGGDDESAVPDLNPGAPDYDAELITLLLRLVKDKERHCKDQLQLAMCYWPAYCLLRFKYGHEAGQTVMERDIYLKSDSNLKLCK